MIEELVKFLFLPDELQIFEVYSSIARLIQNQWISLGQTFVFVLPKNSKKWITRSS